VANLIEFGPMHCWHCHGSGFCYCDEMPNRAGHDPHDLVVDATRYTCPDCGGTGLDSDDDCDPNELQDDHEYYS
jgi:hypothetical protein